MQEDTQSDSNTSLSVENGAGSNINKTIDFVLKKNGDDHSKLTLICGSFFIMSDVKLYFGQVM